MDIKFQISHDFYFNIRKKDKKWYSRQDMHEKLTFLYSSSESIEQLSPHEQSRSHFPSKEQGQCSAHPFLQEHDLGTPQRKGKIPSYF